MIEYLSIERIALTIWEYDISYIELIGTIFGMLSVYYAAKPDIKTWPTAIINQFAFFVLFFQVQLYADMFLQVYFFIATCYGWYFWRRREVESRVFVLNHQQRATYALVLVLATLTVGYLLQDIHTWFPGIFTLPAAYPFADAFTTVASIMAMVLMARKRIENWILWMAVDVVAVIVYFLKDIRLIAVEFIIFFIICVFGFVRWRQQLTHTNS
ncbi:MAG: nicotinamide riboside transporter PnuC [Bacteroidetes bacterium]|nr:MAG: nicotinamide riboside transporter PnuC [Bacteroidota bacterium]